jgi:phage/plasmid-associated DNA primase
MSLQIYHDYGFKLFPCKADKTPDTPGDWRAEENHITVEQAEYLQSIGRMIGAWIPENVIVIDLDRHEGKPDGVEGMREIKKKWGINFGLLEDTLAVNTPSNGYHIYFITESENKFSNGEKAPGIILNNNDDYIIAAGSPGYLANRYKLVLLPLEIENWLEDCEKNKINESAIKLDEDRFSALKPSKKILSLTRLKNILYNVDATNFRDPEKWLSFIMSAMSVSGTGKTILKVLDQWIKNDPQYTDDRDIYKIFLNYSAIEQIPKENFFYLLKSENLNDYQLREIRNLQSTTDIIENAQKEETDLPFNGVDYTTLSTTPAAYKFYTQQGHTNAAAILFLALNGKVIFVEGEKISYYFDGNRWEHLHDPYSVIYTILLRVSIMIYNKGNDKIDNEECIKKIMICINTLYQKESIWKEFTRQAGIYNISIDWDSPRNKETITCNDGVIDFTSGKATKRNGTQQEFRRHYIDYTCDEIAGSGKPIKFIQFLDDIIPDKDTLDTLIYYLSCMISGNASKRIFSIWKGPGKNGKSTLQEIIRQVIGKKLVKIFDVALILQNRREGVTLGPTPEQAKLQGCIAAFTSEVDATQKLNAAKIKNLCGDETITGSPKFKDPIEFEATWQMILLCNDFPHFDANNNALIDRLLIIPFNIKYVKSDAERESWITKGIKRKFLKDAKDKKKFIPEILEERAGILRYLIEKYIELETKFDGNIPESKECENLKRKYIKDNDDFGTFIDNFCVIDTEADYFTTNTKITELYREYMDNPKLSAQYVTNGIIKSTNEVVQKISKTISERDEYGGVRYKTHRGLLHIKIDEDKKRTDEQKEKLADGEDLEIPF